MSSTAASGSPQAKGELKKDASKSTAEGEWEMRDGKWYRRDYYSMNKQEKPKEVLKVACQVCPTYVEKITILTRERDELKLLLGERDRLIMELRSRLERYEIESKTWISDRRVLEQRIRELESLLRERADWVSSKVILEKETLIVNLNKRIEELIMERDGQAARILKLQETIETFEKQFSICKSKGFPCNCKDAPQQPRAMMIQMPGKWYYAVQDYRFAQLFQTDPSYKGGEIIIDPLEGATVVNPEYYSQAENVPGTARLRIRLVDYNSMGTQVWPGTELFVRLKLGEATQFTQARPFQISTVTWHQDLVFIEVPLKTHPSDPSVNCSVHPLVVEIVSRAIGTVAETVVGSASIDIQDLIMGLTRIVPAQMSSGGVLNIRVKALDFGLPQTMSGQIIQFIQPGTIIQSGGVSGVVSEASAQQSGMQMYTTVQHTVTSSGSEIASTPLP